MFVSVQLRALLFATLAFSLASCGLSARPVEPAPPPPPPKSVVGLPVKGLEPAGIPGAVPVVLHTDGPAAVRAQWVYINGAEPYNNQLDAQLLGILDQNAGGRYDPSVPDPAKPAMANGLQLAQEVIMAGGPLLGTRFTRSKVENGSIATVSVTTEYRDPSTGVTTGGPALISAGSLEDVRKLLNDAVQASQQPAAPSSTPTGNASANAVETPSHPAPVEDPMPAEVLLAGAAFSPGGELVVPLSAHPVSGAALASPQTVHISAGAAAPLLSDLGRQVQQLAGTGLPLAPPAPAAPGQEHVNCDLVPCAALTYDDGPNTQTTRLLGILAAHSVHATFFQQGVNVAAYPAIAAAVAAAGHSIGNHTMNHPDLTKLTDAQVRAQVRGASANILRVSGVSPPFLRPPYGASNAMVQRAVGLPLIDLSADSLDWQSRNKEVFIPRVLDLVRPGGIVLLHDIHATTVDGQDQLITTLQGQGYHLVTVPQLFHGIELQNGRAYFCRGTSSPCTASR